MALPHDISLSRDQGHCSGDCKGHEMKLSRRLLGSLVTGCPLVLVLMLSTTTGCTPAQRQKFNEALIAVANDPAVNKVINDAAEWLVLNYLNTSLVSNLPMREQTGKATVGRWYLTKLQPQRVSDEIVQVTYEGAGYSGNADHNTGITYVAKATVPYRVHVVAEQDYWFVQFVQEGQITDAYFQAQRVFRGEYSAFFRVLTWINWLFTGNTPTDEANHIGLNFMLDRFEEGFTVRINKKLKHDIGLGIGHDAEYAHKPFNTAGWAHTEHYNENVKLWKEGRDFLGPIRIRKGDRLKIFVQSNAPVDMYLSEDTPARQELASHINPKLCPDANRSCIAAQSGCTEWNAYYDAPRDITVWLIIDNTSQGEAQPREQAITASVAIGTQ